MDIGSPLITSSGEKEDVALRASGHYQIPVANNPEKNYNIGAVGSNNAWMISPFFWGRKFFPQCQN